MSAAHRQVKTALDETRLLILGAQILLGFHLNAAFQAGFTKLSAVSYALYTAAFSAMAIGVGLLIAPSMQHLIVDRGRSNQRILSATTWFAGCALLPLAFSLGADLAIVMTYRFGGSAGAAVGGVAAALALLLWYGAEWVARGRRHEGGRRMEEEDTPLDVRVEHMLTEARVLLPGAQALLGFQMAVLLTDGFADLPASSKVIHAVALCSIALTIIILMAPAAFHRITFDGQNTESFYRIGSAFVIASAVPLAIGIVGDLYVAATRATGPTVGAIAAGSIGLTLLALWFVQPLLIRNASGRQERVPR